MVSDAKTHERNKITQMSSKNEWIVAVEVCWKTYCKIDKDGEKLQC